MPTFTNQATLTSSFGVASSNVVTGSIVQVLSLQKSVLGGDYAAGDTLTYVISLINSGETAVHDLTVTDDLGAFAFGGATVYPLTPAGDTVGYYVNGEEQPPLAAAQPPLTVTGVAVPAGGSVLLIYRARVNDFASPQTAGVIENTVTVDGPTLSAPLTAAATVTAAARPVLTLGKTVTPNPVTENGQLTYTLTVENSGNTAAAAGDSLAVGDTFSPVLSGLTVTLDGAPLTVNTGYTYDAATGAFATVPGVITVPAATFTQDETTGRWLTAPGTAVLQITGTL
ncbi:MAG: DUF11 domain-containing protein [Oscillospiraceae bacterium]|nr:DUF11 domain-containing protein [Oscillospiraceae bacterium]